MFYGRGSEIPKSDREETRCALFFLPGAIRPRLIYGETEARPTHALFFCLQNTYSVPRDRLISTIRFTEMIRIIQLEYGPQNHFRYNIISVIISLRLRSNNSFFRADVFCIGFSGMPHARFRLNLYFSLFSTSFCFMKRRMSFAIPRPNYLSVYLVSLILTQLSVFIYTKVKNIFNFF